MNATLKVTPEIAKSKSMEMQAKGQEIKNLTAQITQIIDSITGRIWSGEAAAAYLNSFHTLQVEVDQLVKMVNDNASHLNQIAVAYESTESSAVQKTSSLNKSFL